MKVLQKFPSTVMDNEIFKAARQVTSLLQQTGYQTYFVGGAVRDLLMGVKPKDIDIVTDALPEQVMQLFPNTHPIGAAFGIITVVMNGYPFEVATLREERDYLDGRRPECVIYTDNIELDAARRDFTINGIFYDPHNEQLFDFNNGREDLKCGIIRTIGDAEARFSEDYLRMMRAVRFANRFNFTLHPDIIPAVTKLKTNLSRLANERIREELNGILTGHNPAAGIGMLHKLGMLEIILPEVAALDGVTQPEKYHPEGDVMVHTMIMLEHMQLPSVKLAWSILLHDIGKPPVKTVGDDGIEHFYCHEQVGAKISRTIMQRFKFSSEITDAVVDAVQNHMKFAHIDKMRQAKWRRLMASPEFPLEIELHRVDCISSHAMLGNYNLLLDRFTEAAGAIELPPPLITGRDLIELGMKPGPQFKKILTKLADLQLSGKLTSKVQAIAYLHGKK
ncbi:MAG: CCA tRNA nucleotidyltransferase [Victivallaceae bacterium]|nr:CCA tRNA nucleotidyltransferase [Victivallaceae bacterium]